MGQAVPTRGQPLLAVPPSVATPFVATDGRRRPWKEAKHDEARELPAYNLRNLIWG
jgi:hypothetical protein